MCSSPRATLTALSLALLVTTAGCGDSDGNGLSAEWGEAYDAFATGWLLHVWASGPNDVYAVGGTPDRGAIAHFDGSTWTQMDPSEATGETVPLLNWVHGFGPDDVYVVGGGGTVLHWDGSGWTRQETPTDQNLWGIWGASPNELWAVGGEGRMEGQATILRYDGTTWTQHAVPELMRARVFAFFKVWGTSADNVLVVGQNGAVLRWDGTMWNEELVGTGEDLIALWGTGPDRIVLVGGRGNGQAVTWDGSEWTHRSLSPVAGLNGVWMRNDNVAHIAGERGTLGTLDFDTLEVTEDLQDTDLDFHALFGTGGNALYAVGGNFLNFATGPYNGIALRRGLLSSE